MNIANNGLNIATSLNPIRLDSGGPEMVPSRRYVRELII